MYFDTIAKNIAERTGCDIATIKPESKFTELGIDSLDMVEMVMDRIAALSGQERAPEYASDVKRRLRAEQAAAKPAGTRRRRR